MHWYNQPSEGGGGGSLLVCVHLEKRVRQLDKAKTKTSKSKMWVAPMFCVGAQEEEKK